MVQNDKTTEVPPLGGEQSPSPVSGEVCGEAPGPAEETGIAVETTGLRKFISGVVEGKKKYIYTSTRTTGYQNIYHHRLSRPISVVRNVGRFRIDDK